ncbi:hypothetical protein AZE42_08441 [Rhizopogon vesiculosus]|uniref:Uncharacterized protein n=1 Tax=Rhizopogon vesiculosus TaxID=180088 RepID=A0A1J8PIW6_9AGAM|nr:hypothetical protein AZE42_08441 [Rhizopogon vesiculosus]
MSHHLLLPPHLNSSNHSQYLLPQGRLEFILQLDITRP